MVSGDPRRTQRLSLSRVSLQFVLLPCTGWHRSPGLPLCLTQAAVPVGWGWFPAGTVWTCSATQEKCWPKKPQFLGHKMEIMKPHLPWQVVVAFQGGAYDGPVSTPSVLLPARLATACPTFLWMFPVEVKSDPLSPCERRGAESLVWGQGGMRPGLLAPGFGPNL